MLGKKVVKMKFVIVAFCIMITAISFWIAKDLSVATDLSEMLPEGHVLQAAHENFEAAFGSGEKVYLAIATKYNTELDKDKRHSAALKLVDILNSSETVDYIEAGQPEVGVFLDALKGGMTVVVVTPKLDESDFVQQRKLFFTEIEDAFKRTSSEINAEVKKGENPIDVEFAYTGGAFVQDYEADGVLEKGIFASIGIVLALIILVVCIAFKRFWLPLSLSIPLLMGVIITAAIGKLIFGTLNLFSVFFAAVLFGLGIDFGVHLLARYDALRKEQYSVEEALNGMFTSSGVGIGIGALTTAAAFLSFTVTSFKGFRQMGSIAGIGVIALALVMLLMVPAMIVLIKDRKETQASLKGVDPSITGLDATKNKASLKALQWLKTAVIGCLVLFGVIGSLQLFNLKPFGLEPLTFDYSLEAIYPQNMTSTQWQHRLETAYDTRIENLSVVMPNLEALYRAHQALEPLEKKGEIRTKSLLTLSRKMLKLEAVPYAEMSLDSIEGLITKLPISLVNNWVGKAIGNGDTKVFRLEVTSTKPIVTLEAFEAYEKQVLDATKEQPIGFIALMMHLGKLVTNDVLLVGGVCIILTLVLLIFTFRNWFMTLVILIGLSLTIFSTWAIAGLMGLSLNLMSVIALPIVIGIGIDGFVHIGHGLMHRSESASFDDLYRALAVTTLTTIIGFGNLALVNHGGLSNLGIFTGIGMANAFCFQIFFLPPVYRWGKKIKSLSKNL